VRPGQPGKNGGEGTGLAGSHPDQLAAVAAPAVTPRHDSDHDKQDDKPQRKPVTRKRPQALTGQAKAAAVLAAEPGLTNAEVHDRTGVSVRTVQRARNGKTGSKP
jgi:hypothetical protein